MLKPTENVIYSKFQTLKTFQTLNSLRMLITFVRNGFVSMICNVGSGVNKGKPQISILNNKRPSMGPCGTP